MNNKRGAGVYLSIVIGIALFILLFNLLLVVRPTYIEMVKDMKCTVADAPGFANESSGTSHAMVCLVASSAFFYIGLIFISAALSIIVARFMK